MLGQLLSKIVTKILCFQSTCTIAVGTNLSQFICISGFTAVSFQVLGHMKTILVLIMGFFFFRRRVSICMWFWEWSQLQFFFGKGHSCSWNEWSQHTLYVAFCQGRDLFSPSSCHLNVQSNHSKDHLKHKRTSSSQSETETSLGPNA